MDRIVLTASLEVLRSRVGQDPNRPLWDEAVEERFRSRAEAYREADLVVDTTACSVEEVVERILARRGYKAP